MQRYASDSMGEMKRQEKDVVLLCGPTEDGGGVQVLRAREDRVETGEVRPVKDGQPIVGDVVKLTQHADEPRLCDVEVLHEGERAAPKKSAGAKTSGGRLTRGGPAQVATKAYRDQWTRVFGDGDDEPASSKNMN
jgi:hypothetical protein